jgi:hypothetical protein
MIQVARIKSSARPSTHPLTNATLLSLEFGWQIMRILPTMARGLRAMPDASGSVSRTAPTKSNPPKVRRAPRRLIQPTDGLPSALGATLPRNVSSSARKMAPSYLLPIRTRCELKKTRNRLQAAI